jgi:hypothetical protein
MKKIAFPSFNARWATEDQPRFQDLFGATHGGHLQKCFYSFVFVTRLYKSISIPFFPFLA